MPSEIIGRLETIRRYPVKSMAGEVVDAVYVHETGLNGDRVFAFYDHDSKREGLPYLTGREKRQLLLLKPKIVDEPDKTKPYLDGYQPRIEVVLPGSAEAYELSDPAVINYIKELCYPKEIRVTLDYRRAGMQDSKPISIIGLPTIDQLTKETGIVIDPRRFRENFYITWNTQSPFFEDGLVGKCLQIGDDLLIHIVQRNERCPMICADPDTAGYDKKVLGTVAKLHEKNVGVYAMVRHPGVAHQGDQVIMQE